MNRALILSIAMLFLHSGAIASSASAGEPRARQVRQRARIQTAAVEGSLVRREARRLRHEQRIIQTTKRRMLADDGKLGPVEQARLQRMQDRASRHIFRAKHNARAR